MQIRGSFSNYLENRLLGLQIGKYLILFLLYQEKNNKFRIFFFDFPNGNKTTNEIAYILVTKTEEDEEEVKSDKKSKKEVVFISNQIFNVNLPAKNFFEKRRKTKRIRYYDIQNESNIGRIFRNFRHL